MQLRLKELREDLCLSVKDMARDTGVSQNTIHLYERGRYPSIKQIEMIAKTYDVNPAWLVGWVDDAVSENTLNKEDTLQDIVDMIDRCDTFAQLKGELRSYFKLD